MIFYCVEPAHDDVAKKRDYFDWTFVIKKGFGHHVVYPHVDSCLGVICKLADDRVFTGHINGYFEGDYSAASHGKAFQAMVDRMGSSGVAKAVVVGDVRTWREYVNIPQKLACKHISFLISPQAHFPNGIDVMVNIDSGTVRLAKYQKDRDFRTGMSVGNDVNLHAVDGIKDVSCK